MNVHFKTKTMKEKIKIKGKTYVKLYGSCRDCDLAENCNIECNSESRYHLKRYHNPIKETLKILALLAFLGAGAYFVHKSTENKAPAPPKTSKTDSLEELKRLDDIYLQKLVSLQNNDSLKMIGELYEINCAKIKEMER